MILGFRVLPSPARAPKETIAALSKYDVSNLCDSMGRTHNAAGGALQPMHRGGKLCGPAVTVLPPRLNSPAIRVVRMSGDSLTQGIERIEVDGVKVPVFNAAKTIADCFKFRNKIGLDVALEALREGWRERKVKMEGLWRYAKLNRVANVMRPYLEAMT